MQLFSADNTMFFKKIWTGKVEKKPPEVAKKYSI